MLIEHLHSDDFFDVGRCPVAKFQVRRVEAVPGAGPGMPNLEIHGELTLRGRVNPLVLQATSGFTPEGRFGAQAALAFDRTLWGSIYGSGKFFHRLGMHLVNDLIEVRVRLLV
jgi:polyisoprenoid-binding protein YceI